MPNIQCPLIPDRIGSDHHLKCLKTANIKNLEVQNQKLCQPLEVVRSILTRLYYSIVNKIIYNRAIVIDDSYSYTTGPLLVQSRYGRKPIRYLGNRDGAILN